MSFLVCGRYTEYYLCYLVLDFRQTFKKTIYDLTPRLPTKQARRPVSAVLSRGAYVVKTLQPMLLLLLLLLLRHRQWRCRTLSHVPQKQYVDMRLIMYMLTAFLADICFLSHSWFQDLTKRHIKDSLRMCYFASLSSVIVALQWFDTVGWASGRASGL